jgi:hypothetical protein
MAADRVVCFSIVNSVILWENFSQGPPPLVGGVRGGGLQKLKAFGSPPPNLPHQGGGTVLLESKIFYLINN